MLISEMHNQFRIEYDSIDAFSNPEYSPVEVDSFLNSAQDNLIEKAKREGLESSETLRNYLSNLILNSNINIFTTNGDNLPNGTFVTLPADFRITLKESVTIDYEDCNAADQTRIIPVIPTTHDRINVDTRNPFKRPNKEERVLSLPFSTLNTTDQTVELITDGTFTVQTYHLRYLKDPVQMQYGTQYPTPVADINCELNEEAQNWIVSEAVRLAMIATSQLQKVQIMDNLSSNKK